MRGSSLFARIKSELLGQDTWELTRPPPHSFRRGSRAWPSFLPHAPPTEPSWAQSARSHFCVSGFQSSLCPTVSVGSYFCYCMIAAVSWAPLLCPSSPLFSAVSLCLLWPCFLCLTQSRPSCPSSCCCSLLLLLFFLPPPATFYFSLAVVF